MEAAANKLQKEAKGYLDSLRGWCRSDDGRDGMYSCSDSDDGIANADRRNN